MSLNIPLFNIIEVLVAVVILLKRLRVKRHTVFENCSIFGACGVLASFLRSNFLQLLENCVHPRGCTNTMHNGMTQNVFLKINK
jgi:uncharacterized membrane protein